MIKVQDWIPSIPDEEKHIAYVGEGLSEQRTFLLCGDGWEAYEDWGFHLDMAFDPESITTRDSRQVVQTTVNGTQEKTETLNNTEQVTTKESYTVHSEERPDYDLTDIAPLDKRVEDDGIHLTWTVLRQHTNLPGKLWATIRAVGSEANQIKKSAVMVFEVDPAVCAVPAVRPPISEMEQMMVQMDTLRLQTYEAAESALDSSRSAHSSATTASQQCTLALESANVALRYSSSAQAAAQDAGRWYNETVDRAVMAEDHATAAQQAADVANEKCTAAADAADTAKGYATDAQTILNDVNQKGAEATQAAQDATDAAQDAADAAQTATQQAAEAEADRNQAMGAVAQCSHYTRLCETYAEQLGEGAGVMVEHNRINVRDYGALGDGVTDDRPAILAAFDAAKAFIAQGTPCEVYFPAGTYGISNGITVNMDYGTGGLLVRGAGRDVTTIKYLESYDPNQVGNMWYAIRIWPVGMPGVKPTNEKDYLHDISITGLTVYDTDPIAHAWNPAKGDPSKEETHGFDIQYCKRVSVTDCTIDSVGDEGIDICGCHDVVVMNNHLVNSPAAGTAGGAISIGDACRNVVVSGNTINGTAEKETLADGTVLTKRNFGIAVESLYLPVYDVVISGNTITSVRGHGINIGATNAGSGVYNISVNGNMMTDCCKGINVMDTQYPKSDISIVNNVIIGCSGDLSTDGIALYTGTKTYNLLISDNIIKDIEGEYAAKIVVADHALLSDNLFQDTLGYALLISGDVMVRNCVFHNIGTGGNAAQAIQKIDSSWNKLTITGCCMKGIYCGVGIRNVDVIEYTDIELVNGGTIVASKYLTRVIGGRFNGILTLSKDGAVMQGVTIEANTAGNHAVTIAANGVSVTGCHIYVGTTKKAIIENDGYTGNLVTNNIVNGTLSTAAVLILADNEGTVCANNVDLRTLTA